MKPKLRVMLVDDRPAARAEYRSRLSQSAAIEVVAEASTGEEACRHCPAIRPGLVLMDISLPGTGGISALRQVAKQCGPAKILVLSTHQETAYVAKAMLAGAKGYAVKDSDAEGLTVAVLRVAAGHKHLDPGIAQRLALRSAEQSRWDARLGTLPPREFDILSLFAQGYNPRQVSDALELEPSTVANYASRLRDKLGAQPDESLREVAHRYGLYGK
jgi:two-component system invasion response regulator UvrY